VSELNPGFGFAVCGEAEAGMRRRGSLPAPFGGGSRGCSCGRPRRCALLHGVRNGRRTHHL